MKRITKVLLAVVIAVSLIVAVNLTVNAATSGIYTYTVTDGKATITGCDQSVTGELVIPSTLGGYPVTSIGEAGFYWCKYLTSVKIPEGVTSIGHMAFYHCEELAEISLASTLTTIEQYAFDGCKSLKSLAIPESMTSIGECALYGCSALESVTIPDSVTSIGRSAFGYCTSLTSVTLPDGITELSETSIFEYCTSLEEIVIPDGVKTIGWWVFKACSSLKRITIPASVTSIGNGAFDYCSSLRYVYYGGTQSQWDKINISNNNIYLTNATIRLPGEWDEPEVPGLDTDYGYVLSDGKIILTSRPADTGKEITIPAEIGGYPVIAIGDNVFKGCTSLKKVIISDGITSIGESAFANCTALSEIIIPGSVKTIGNSSFSNCWSLSSVTIPSGVTSIGNHAFEKSGLTGITIPNSVTNIEYSAFFKCESLTSVNIGNGITTLPANMFEECIALTEIVIPDTVTTLESSIFINCTALENVRLSKNVKTIPMGMFYGCTALESITIPSSVTVIQTSAFSGASVKDVYYTGSPNAWSQVVIWENNDCITAATVHCSVEDETVSMFQYYEDNGEIIITDCVPDTTEIIVPLEMDGYPVTTIAAGAFSTCTEVTSIVIPSNVTNIETGAFSGCVALEYIHMEENLNYKSVNGNLYSKDGTELIRYAPAKFEETFTFTVPDGVMTIGDGAFSDASFLQTVTLPDGVISIGYGAFSDCPVLKTVNIPESVISIGVNAFDHCVALKNIKLPSKITTVADSTFNYCTSLTSMDIPGGVTRIGEYAFHYCTSLSSVTIPDSVTSIGEYAFYNCTSLTSIKIPEGVTSIGYKAFDSCTSLTTVNYAGSSSQWGSISVGSSNAPLLGATITFGKTAEPIELTDDLVDYRLRCTTAVINGNLVMTAATAGGSSMKIRLGNLPEGATLAFAETNANASMASGIITVTNPGMGKVEVPMVIISADGVTTEFVLVGDFGNIVKYMLRAKLAQSGTTLTLTSGNTNMYIGFDGTVTVKSASRNMLGRYTVSSGKYIRFYNPVYDDGSFVIEVAKADGTVVTYNVTTKFATKTYTPIVASLRATYKVSSNTITVTANTGVTNVYLQIGKYYGEKLSTVSAEEQYVKQIEAKGWRIYRSSKAVDFYIVFDASSYGADKVSRHIVVNF